MENKIEEMDLFDLKDVPREYNQDRLNYFYKIQGMISDIIHKSANTQKEQSSLFLYDIRIEIYRTLFNYFTKRVVQFTNLEDFKKIKFTHLIKLGKNKIYIKIEVGEIIFCVAWFGEEGKFYFTSHELEELEIKYVKIKRLIKITNNIIENEREKLYEDFITD